MRKRTAELYPVPPVNVRLIGPKGEPVPVDCVYVGMRDRVFVWHVLWPEGLERAVGLLCDTLPAKTSIHVVPPNRP